MHRQLVVFILFSFTLRAQLVVPLRTAGPYLLVNGVYLNGQGPFRFLLDTGAQTTEVTPGVARQLALRPSYRVEVVSVNGRKPALGTRIANVTLGAASVLDIEVVWYDLGPKQRVDQSIAGVLGQSFLSKFQYWIDVEGRELRFEQDVEPASGMKLPMEGVDGRPVICWKGRRMVLDSGAPQVIVYKKRREGMSLVDGLLPVTSFRSVFVNSAERYVILN